MSSSAWQDRLVRGRLVAVELLVTGGEPSLSLARRAGTVLGTT